MKQLNVIPYPPHLSAVILDQWLVPLQGRCWDALREAADESVPQSACYWELHPCGGRVDLCGVSSFKSPRERARLTRWIDAQRTEPTPRGLAALALQPWLTRSDDVDAVGWEEDTNEHGGVGIFAAFHRGADLTACVQLAYDSFGLSEAVIAQSEALLASVAGALRVIALGSFFGRDAAPELRLILRPTRKDWQTHLPDALRDEVDELCAALPPDSDINLALSVQPQGLYPALETRFSTARLANAAWAPWLAAVLPSRQPLQQLLIDALVAHVGPQTPKRWPAEVLLDAFLMPQDHVPVLEGTFSHVKVRRGQDGTLERKLYLLFEQRWRQLG